MRFSVSKSFVYALLLSTSGLTAPAYANPQDGVVSAGSATITTSGTTLNIHQSSDRAVIDWRSFDIDPNETTNFYQPSSSSLTVNRINSNDPSKILGTLNANGQIVLINPNGVFFGAGSHIDVGGLTATSADISNADAMAGRMNFSKAGHADAKIVNEGTITAADQGLVSLVAPQVENSGVITATLGTVNLASGETFTLDFANDGVLAVAVDRDTLPKQAVTNSGKISANGGQVHITAAAARSVVDSLITNTGVIEAKSVGYKKGSVTLSAEGRNAVKKNVTQDKGQKSGQSHVVNSGTIDVSGVQGNESGGFAALLGDDLWIEAGSIITADGANGGGTIKIGGDYHGEGETPTAQNVYVAGDTKISADALEHGNGGNVTLWADGATKFFGDISARGGAYDGDGGFVEVSGKDFLKYRGRVDTTAANGEIGLLLLDPTDIVIMNGTGDGNDADASSTSFAGTASAAGTIIGTDAGPSTLYESELQGIVATTSVAVTATNSITVNDLADNTLGMLQTGARTVTFTATGGNFTMLDTNDTISTAGGALTISSGGTATIGNLTVGGAGAMSVSATNGGTIGNLTSTSGSIGVTSSGGGFTINNVAMTGSTFTLNNAGATTINGVISGTGTAFTKSTGTGSLTLNGTNTYTGLTTLTTGNVIIGNNAAFGTGTLTLNGSSLQVDTTARTLANTVIVPATTTTITGTADLTFNGSVQNTRGNTITINNNGTGTVNFTNLALANGTTGRTTALGGTGNFNISGVISNGSTGASSLSKAGAGLLTITGNSSTYTGTTTLTAGTMRVTNAGGLGTSALSLGGGTLQLAADTNTNFGRNTTLTASTTVEVDRLTSGAGVTHTLGTLSTTGGTLTVNAGSNVTSGTAGLTVGATTVGATTGFNTGSGTVLTLGALADGGSTARAVTKSGAGTLFLGATASQWALADTLTINGGTVQLGATNAMGTGTTTAVTVNGITASTTTLFDLNGFNQGILNLTLGGATATSTSTNNVSTGAGTLTLGGGVTYTATNNPLASTISGKLDLGASARTFNIGDSSSTGTELIVDAVISGTGGITKATGAGELVLNGNNTYSGTTTLSAGTLRATQANAMGSGALSLGGGILELAADTNTNFGRNTTVTAATVITIDRLTSNAAVTHTLGTLSQGAFALTTNAGSNIASGTAGLIFGATTYTGNPTYTTNVNSQLTLGTLSDGAAARTIVKNGVGSVVFNASATQWAAANILTINNGTVQLGAGNAFGSGTTTAVTVNGTAASTTTLFDLNNFSQGILSLTLGTTGGTTTSTNNVSTGTGTLTLGGGITFNNTVNTPGSSITGKIDLGSANRTFTVADSTNAATDLTIDAVISGTGGVIKAGAGVMVLNGSNTFTGAYSTGVGTTRATNAASLGAGALALSGGTLEILSDTALNFDRNTTISAATAITSDRVLQGAGVNHTFGTLSQGAFALTTNAGGNVTSGNADITFGATTYTGAPTYTTNTNTRVILGALSDGTVARTITKSGAGSLIFNAIATQWAAANILTINNGTVQIGATNAFGSGTTTSATVNSTVAGQTALLDLGGFSQGLLNLGFGGASGTSTSTNTVNTGAGTLTLGGNITTTATGNSVNSNTLNGILALGSANRTVTVADSSGTTSDLVINAVISGTGGLIKAGAGTLVLTGTNTFTGAAATGTGVVRITDVANLGAGALTLGGGTLEIDTDSDLNFAKNTTVTAATAINMDRLTLGAGVTHTFGTLSQGAFALTTNTSNVDSGVSSVVFGASTMTGNASFVTNTNTQITLGALADGGSAKALVKSGAGTLLLNATANTWNAADTLAINNGTVKLGAVNALGTGTTTAVTVNSTVAGQTALLDLNNFNQGVLSLTFGGTGATSTSTNNVSTGTGTLTLGGNVNYTNTNSPLASTLSGKLNLGSATRTFTTSQSGSADSELIITADISGTGGITKAGGGDMTLSGTNTYSGTTTINTGRLILAGGNAILDTGSIVFLDAAASIELNNNETVGTLAGGGTSGGNISLGAYDLTFGGTANTSYAGIISGTGSVTKKGSGTQTITGAHTYTGDTTVDAGILRLGAANLIHNSSDLVVNSSGTFDFNDFSETVASILSAGVVDFGTGNTITTAGNQTYTGSVVGGSVTLNSSGGGDILADNTANNFTGTVTSTTTGDLTLIDANALILGPISARTVSAFANNGDLMLTDQITASATSGTSILLVTTDDFDNGQGSDALQVAGTSNWLVYSDGPAGDTRGGLNYDFKQYDAVYGDTILGSGNGFIYKIAPVITVGLTGTVQKTYNATNTATLAAGNYSISGNIDGDTITLNNPTSGTYADANAGTGKVVTASGLSISSAKNGTDNVYGYTLSSTSASDAVGDIDKAAITVSTSNVTKTYDGTITASGAATLTNGTLYGSDSLSGGSFVFTNANAGTGNKTVTVSGVGVSDGNSGNNYDVTQADNTTSTINKANLTISTSDVTRDYDGSLAAAGTATVTSGTLYTNASNSNTLDSISGGTFAFTNANAGTGKTVTTSGVIVDDGNSGGNYNVTYANNTSSTINKAALTISTSDVTKTYNASTAASGTAVITSGSLYTNASNSNTLDSLSGGSFVFDDANAGTGKTVTVSGVTVSDGNSGGNYDVTYEDNTNSTINQANLTIGTSNVTKTYNGSLAASGTATVTSGTLYGSDGISGGSFAFTDANAGTGKTVTTSGVTVSDGNSGGNYNVSYANNTNSVINKANITVSTSDVTKTYDSTTAASGTATVTSGTLYTNVSNANTLDSISGGSFAFTNANAGTNKTVTTSAVAVNDGNSGGNYNVSYANNTASTINKANLTVSTSDITKTYNASTTASGTATVTSGTLYGSDGISGGSYAFTNANAGTGKTVTVSGVTVSDGNSGGNYNLSYADNTNSTINQANITISTSNVTKTYDSTTAASGTANVTSGTLYGSDSLSGGSFAFTNANAGMNKTVTVGGVTLNDGNSGGNYNVSYANNTTSTINKANLTIGTSNVTKTYDATTAASGTATITSGALQGSDTISGGSFVFTNANAGTNKVVTTSGVTVNDGNSGGNYNVSYANNTASTINKANLTVSTSNVTKTYDATTAASGTATVTSGTLYGSDGLSGGSFAFTNANAGTNKTVTVGGVTISDGNSGGNYNVTYTNNTTSTINKAPLTASTSNVTKVYDGTTTAAGSPVVTSGSLRGSDTLVGGTFAYTDPNVGVNKTVTVSGITVSDGNSGNNYLLTLANNTNSIILASAPPPVAPPTSPPPQVIESVIASVASTSSNSTSSSTQSQESASTPINNVTVTANFVAGEPAPAVFEFSADLGGSAAFTPDAGYTMQETNVTYGDTASTQSSETSAPVNEESGAPDDGQSENSNESDEDCADGDSDC